MGPIDEAPTPQNTPATAAGSYIQRAAELQGIPPTISENALLSNPLLQAMIENKLQTLVGEDSGYISALPRELKKRIYHVKALQKDQFDLEAQFQMRLLELEREFASKFKIVNDKRRALVVGEMEADDELAKVGKELLDEEEDEDEDEEQEDGEGESKADSGLVGIPGFWLTALQNVPILNNMITDRDFDVLDTLIDIRLEYLDTPGYKLVFEFEKDNEFFTNSELTKTYYYQKELGYTGEFVYDHSEGCEIAWKSDSVNATIEVEQRKQRNKHTKQVRVVEKVTHVESFFNFFAPPQLDEIDEEEDDEVSDELAEALQLDYMFGEMIKDKLIPRAIDCFTGEALGNGLFDMPQEDEEGEEDYDEEEEDEDDDDEDGENDDDDDEEEEEGDNVQHVAHDKQKECQNQ